MPEPRSNRHRVTQVEKFQVFSFKFQVKHTHLALRFEAVTPSLLRLK